MAESTTSTLIDALRAEVHRTVWDVQALAPSLRPEGTSSRVIGFDRARGRLGMEISHGPGPGDTRRFRLALSVSRCDRAAGEIATAPPAATIIRSGDVEGIEHVDSRGSGPEPFDSARPWLGVDASLGRPGRPLADHR